MPISLGDVLYITAWEEALNSAVEKAAVETGARYIDLWPSSADRDARQPTSQRWIEPVNGPINADPVHPNTAGEAAMAAQMLIQLGIDDHDHNSGKAGDDADGQHRAVEIEDLPGRLHRCRVGPTRPRPNHSSQEDSYAPRHERRRCPSHP